MVYVIKISSFLPLFTDKPTTWSWERNRAKPSDGFFERRLNCLKGVTNVLRSNVDRC